MVDVFMNASIRNQGMSGTATVVSEIEELLARQSDIVLFVEQGPSPWGKPGPFGRVIRWMQSVWWDGWAAGRRHRTDASIYPTGVGGWFSHSNRNILVVHDLMVFDRRLGYDRGFRLTCTVTWFLSAVAADVIVTPSEWTRSELIRRWPWATNKTVIIPWACRLEARVGPFKQWDPNRRPDVVMVSSVEPHKDHARGVLVVHLARELSGVDFSLSIVGPRGRAEDELRAMIETYDPDGRWIQRRESVGDGELVEILDEAFILLNTSRAEGFGLPLLEAAARDLPVVHSGAGSMNDVLPSAHGSEVTTRALAKEIVSLTDPEEYAASVERGRKALARQTPAGFERALLEVIHGARGPS
jgi:glycosyltransferase involved in cell wall biosynthesis